jgi:hypothetical protein
MSDRMDPDQVVFWLKQALIGAVCGCLVGTVTCLIVVS